jgi:hypothetical protein
VFEAFIAGAVGFIWGGPLAAGAGFTGGLALCVAHSLEDQLNMPEKVASGEPVPARLR